MAKETINLDLDQMWEPVAVGVRRAYVFAGLGTNAARHPDVNDFHLPGLIKFSFVPLRATPELLAEYKRHFESWILAMAFREMLEAYGVTLDSLYRACLLTEATIMRQFVSKARPRKFDHAGIEGKLEIMEKEFEIPSHTRPYLASLNQLRNCLSHRMGIVGPQDCNGAGKLILLFAQWEYLVRHDDGSETAIPPDTASPFLIKEGGTMAIRMSESEKEFNLGSPIVLEANDIRGLFWTVYESARQLKEESLNFFRRKGVKIVPRSE
jgi:hypothetical protein